MYEVRSFPSYHGTPWRTRLLVVAYAYWIVRELAAWGHREVAIWRVPGTEITT